MSERPRRLLVVEDEAGVRTSLDRVLSAAGIHVAFAEDLQGALRHPWRAACDAVLCDLKLADGSALDLMRDLRRAEPALPFVVTTGFATAELVSQAFREGATDVLMKPFDDDELLHVVSRVLGMGGAGASERSGP